MVWLVVSADSKSPPVLLLLAEKPLGTKSLMLFSWTRGIAEALLLSTSTETVDTWQELKFTGITKAEGVAGSVSESESESKSAISEQELGPVNENRTNPCDYNDLFGRKI